MSRNDCDGGRNTRLLRLLSFSSFFPSATTTTTTTTKYKVMNSSPDGDGVVVMEETLDQSILDQSFDPHFSGGIDDDFDPLVTTEDDDGYWVSIEQVKEAAQGSTDGPQATDWKNVNPEEMKYMSVTVDQARQQLFYQARTEIDILEKAWGEKSLSFDKLAERIYGKRSKLYHKLLEEKVVTSYAMFCRFLATFHAACRRGMSVTQLLRDADFKTKGLLPLKEFNSIMTIVQSIGVENNGNIKPVWMNVEEAYNDEVKDTFLKHRGNSHLSLALDDDKEKFNYSKNASTWGLQRCRHIQANRFGFTLHTCAVTAIGIVVCVMFQRESETQTQIYRRMIMFMFGDRCGGGNPNLHRMTFCSDRGYWTSFLVFCMLLFWGADVHGTVKRTHWFPFIYNKLPQGNDAEDKFDRTKVSAKGYRDMFYKTYKYVNGAVRKTVRAIAYRSGTGNVSLAMTTIHNHIGIDFNTTFPKDVVWSFRTRHEESDEKRNRRPFRLVCGSSDTSNLDFLMNNQNVHPLTTVQCDAPWFQMRKFSITSSTAEKTIEERSREIEDDHPLREEYETVLHVVGREKWLSLPTEDSSDDDRTTAAATTPPSAADDDDDLPTDDGSLAYYLITNMDQQATRDDFLRDLDDDDIDAETIRDIVGRHKHSKKTAAIGTLRKQLKAWAEQPSNLHRQYHWYSVAQLKQRLKEIDTRANTTGSKAVLLGVLVDCEKKQTDRNIAMDNGDDPYEHDVDPVLLAVIAASNLKKMNEKQKQYCRKGHENEAKFLKQFQTHSEQGYTLGYKSISIYESPLVQSNDQPFFKDSADGELVCTRENADTSSDTEDDDDDDDGDVEIIPVEVKSRLSHSTFYDERENLRANDGLVAWQQGRPVYHEVDAESRELFSWIPKTQERFQLLHHVAIRKQRKGLILIGDEHHIMFGVFVNYKQETIDAYRTILEDIYDRALRPFYEMDPLEIPREKIVSILTSKEMKSVGMTYHSFIMDLYLWRKLLIEKVLRLPVPPCNRILPIIHSYWNNNKGGSDTTTKLIMTCPVKFASSGRPPTVVFARLLQLFAILLHRQHHSSRANAKWHTYGSLFHIRNTNNKQWPLWNTLKELEVWLVQQADTDQARMAHGSNFQTAPSSNNENVPPRTPARQQRVTFEPAATPPPRRDNPTNPFTERLLVTCTGATPRRGRPAYPKGPLSKAQKEFHHRASKCDGSQYYKAAKNRKKPCHLCRKETPWICMGCHRPACNVNRDTELRKLISEGAKCVAFLNGKKPPADIQFETKGVDGTATVVCKVENSCHHILHGQY